MYWRDNYDLRAIMARDWKTLGPKLRGKLQIDADADRATCEAAALANEQAMRFIGDSAIRKVIVVPGKLVNIVI